MTNGGEALSQVVKAAAEWVTRSPPLGKELPSVSPHQVLGGFVAWEVVAGAGDCCWLIDW